jgi:RNA ligase
MSTTTHYFKENNLFDLPTLEAECERRGVKLRTHPTIDRLKILNYKDEVVYNKSWDNLNRKCRGLVVDVEHKEVMGHSFDKFFNMGEMSESSYENLLEKGTPSVLEKLDGTMVTVFWDQYSNTWQAATRSESGNVYTEYALTKGLPPFLGQDENVKKYTLIFELIDPDFRNVINYTKKGYTPGLYLLGMRDRRTDRLLSRTEVEELRNNSRDLQYFNLPKSYPFTTLNEIAEKAKYLPFTEEGFVLWFPDFTLVKVKSLDYLKIHRLLWEYSDDRVLEILQNNTEKELLEYLQGVPEEFSKDVLDVMEQAKRSQLEIAKEVYTIFAQAPKTSRKDFALWVNANVNSPLRPHLFMLFDNEPVSKERIFGQFRKGTLAWRRETVSI